MSPSHLASSQARLTAVHCRPCKPRETSTERAARKAERKAQKAADAALLLPQDARQAAAETSFYSSTDNPFHDANLGDKFVWGKKREKERKSGITPEEAAAKDRQRHLESVVRGLSFQRGPRYHSLLTSLHIYRRRLRSSISAERSVKPSSPCARRSRCALLGWPSRRRCRLGSTARTTSTSSNPRSVPRFACVSAGPSPSTSSPSTSNGVSRRCSREMRGMRRSRRTRDSDSKLTWTSPT